MISIINCGVGNVRSIQNILDYIGHKSVICSTYKSLKKQSMNKIILPGVGNFDYFINQLQKNNFIELLNELALVKKNYFFGICVGMQALLEGSDEGKMNGLGWIKGKNKRFDNSKGLSIPQIGWNYISDIKNNPLTKGLDSKQRYYFVNSYHPTNIPEKNVLFKSNYGVKFPSGIFKENIYGVQFHPEKSHKYGMKLLNNFCCL